MTIKASKRHSFGMYKEGTTSIQYNSKLYLDNILVPPVKPDDCFTYLGRHFDFKMTDDKNKSDLIDTVTEQIEIIDKIPLNPKSKVELKNRHYWKSAGTSKITNENRLPSKRNTRVPC